MTDQDFDSYAVKGLAIVRQEDPLGEYPKILKEMGKLGGCLSPERYVALAELAMKREEETKK